MNVQDRSLITYNINNGAFIPVNTAVFTVKGDMSLQDCISYLFPNSEYFIDDCSTTSEQHMEYKFLANKTHIIRAFFVTCTSETYALFIADSNVLTKLWINNSLWSVVEGNQKIMVAKLKAGENLICLEAENADSETRIFMRISEYASENSADAIPSPVYGDFAFNGNYGVTKHRGNHLYNGEKFTCAFFPNNDIHGTSLYAKFELYNVFTKEVYLNDSIKVREFYTWDIAAFKIEDENKGNSVAVRIEYMYDNGVVHEDIIPIFAAPVDQMRKYICNRARTALKTDGVTYYDKLGLLFGIEYVEKYGRTLPPIMAQVSLLRKSLDALESGVHLSDDIYTQGEKRVFFYNPNYCAVNYYRVCLPKEYDPAKKYPLILIYSIHEYNAWSKYFAKYSTEPVIAADISGRGVLLGSYMGDAAIQYAVNDLFSRFSIDRSRIYCTGNSNGGGAAWAQLEAYPDLFAGAYIVSGQPNFALLGNLGNIKLINMSSPTDKMYRLSYERVNRSMLWHKDYKAVKGELYSHQALHTVWYNNRIFDELLTAKNNKYPDTVCYKTLRNRHRKAYWVEIHSIDDSRYAGEIKAEVNREKNSIFISCNNITGFSIMLPPQVDHSDFTVCVNSVGVFNFKGYKSNSIHFSSCGSGECGFAQIDQKPELQDMHKGNGLLDVYLDPLSIVVPDNCNEEVKRIAKIYSEPQCNGFIPRIYVQYPIISYTKALEVKNCNNRSFVVIDDGSDHPLLSKIREKAAIRTNNEGWCYKGISRKEQYCVHQIVNSPWDPSKNVHLISCNSLAALRKNMFTRRVVIPTYANGRHTYLNNDALIFNGRYYGICDLGNDIEELNAFTNSIQ